MPAANSTKARSENNSIWLVIAQIGPMKEPEGEEEFVAVDTIVMAWRDTEEEAECECARRNKLEDGRTYFVMSKDEYDSCDVVEKDETDSLQGREEDWKREANSAPIEHDEATSNGVIAEGLNNDRDH